MHLSILDIKKIFSDEQGLGWIRCIRTNVEWSDILQPAFPIDSPEKN